MEKLEQQIILRMLLQIRTEVREFQVASKKVLTITEAAAYTGYKKSHIYRLVSDGFIPYSKPTGKSVFFDRDQLEKWLLSRPHSSLRQNQQKTRRLLGK